MFFARRRTRTGAPPSTPAADASGPKRLGAVVGRAAATVLAGLVLAIVLTLTLELAHGWRSPWPAPLERLQELERGVIALGVLLVWAVIALVHALTNRLWIAALSTSTLVAVTAFANHVKLSLRAEPLFVSDATYLTQTGFIVETVGVGPLVALIVPLVVVGLGMWWLSRSRSTRTAADPLRAGLPRSRASRWGRITTRVLAGAVAGTVLWSAATFNVPGNATRELYEAAGVEWRPWNQAQNYHDNGVIPGLLYNLPSAPMDQPPGYSPDAMADLVERYTALATDLNSTRDAAALADTNIVVILSESLSDPLAMPGISAQEDPMPFLRDLMAHNTSGTLMSGGYGGGTSNVEFEVLTGMAVANLRPQVDSPFPGLVAQADEFPSHLSRLGSPERATWAIHPYAGEFYRRNAVYPALGIERMDFRTTLRDLDKLPGDKYISDAAVFNRVAEELRGSADPMFVNVVTMQNHGPQEGLSDPIPVDGPLTERQRETAGQYLRGLKHSDDALRDFAATLEDMDERTIVLFYGDHLPSVWPEDVLAASGPTGRYETPWVVFANFPTQVHQPGTVGANQLLNQVLDAAGAPHTPWSALLHELAIDVPAMERTGWVGPHGQTISEETLSEHARQVLADYRLAQFDMAAGHGWATGDLVALPED